MGIFNFADFALHSYYPELFHEWLVLSAPVTAPMSRVVLAVDKISHDMHRFHIDERVDVLSNVISIDWLIYLGAISAMVLTLCVAFLTKRKDITEKITEAVEAAGWSFTKVIIGYSIMALLSVSIIYTGLGYYYPFVLYRDDILFMCSFIYFYCALAFPIVLLAVCLAHLFLATTASTVSGRSSRL